MEWAADRGGTGTPAEAEQLRTIRDRLPAVVLGAAALMFSWPVPGVDEPEYEGRVAR
jgi:hypothetical protein